MKRKILLAFAFLFSISLAAFGQDPAITLLTPNSGVPGQTVDVVIRGVNTHFQNGVSQANFGSNDISVTKFVVLNSLTGTATIHIGSGAQTGGRTVTVATGTETAEVVNGFEIFSPSGSFTANLELLPIESISLSDLNVNTPNVSPVLFFINVYNDNVPKNINVTLSLSSDTRGNIGKLTIKNRATTANEYARLTNRDFTDLVLNGASGSQFVNEIQTLGTFPPDNYTYDLKITDASGIVLATGSSTTLVTNPRNNPELIAPGAPFAMPVESVYNPYPMFQWFGQMDRFDFFLYEVRQNQTPEEAVRNLPEYKQLDMTANSLLYPIYAEKLKDGKEYAWQVVGKVNGSGGTQLFPSPVYRFRFVDATAAGGGAGSVASIQVTPQQIEVKAGEQFQFSSLMMDQDNQVLPTATPQWQLAPANKGTITSSGLFTAGSQPTTLAVIAKSGSVTDYALVTIKPATITPVNAGQWMIDAMIRQLFGLPNQ